MIYNMLTNLSKSVREFWQFWSLGGFDLMVLALSNPAQANFFYEADNESSSMATDKPDESTIITRRRKITYSEILTYALPASSKIAEFNNLIDQILVNQQQTSLVERDDSKTAEAMILLSDILDKHWQEFPLKVKVLLLNKLKIFRKNFWKSIFAFSSFHTIKSRLNYYKGYWNELRSYDSLTQKSILNKVSRDSRFLQNAWLALKVTTLKIFKNDGYLLKENRESISEFTNSVKTMVAARQAMNKYSDTLKELAKPENNIIYHDNHKGIKSIDSKNQDYHVVERTLEETAEGLEKFTSFVKYKQDLWENMGAEDRKISNEQFEDLNKYIEESRS